MKRIFILAGVILSTLPIAMAGNKERIGQAGAHELLINPWARSNGWGSSNSACISGVESFNSNISGLSRIKQTEFYYSNLQLFRGSGISINSLAFGQKVGEQGTLGIAVNAMQFGAIEVTTVDNPDGGIGTYRPQFLNLSLAYAHEFSNAIQAGGAVRVVNESINNASSQGVALDAGIRYVTGNVKFGIALRNVGPKMRFSGDGLSQTVILYGQDGQGSEFTVNQRAESFEMPALLNIGVSYDILIGPGEANDTVDKDYRLTLAGTFTSNSFSPDQFRVGAEFGVKQYFAVRGGFVYEAGLLNPLVDGRVNANTGPTMGMSFLVPFKASKTGGGFKVDYSYIMANPLNGTHCLGLQLNI